MERIEVNVETGEVQTIQLTSEEVAAVQTQYAVWQAEQAANPPVVDLQTQIATLMAELNALKLKVGE
jgi:hypothetical protein